MLIKIRLFCVSLCRPPYYLTLFLYGLAVYSISGKTPTRSYIGMRYLSYASNGLFNRLCTFVLRITHKRNTVDRNVEGILGSLSPEKINSIVKDIDEYGYHEFETRLPAEMVEQILSFSLTKPSIPMRSLDDTTEAGNSFSEKPCLYNRESPSSIRQFFDQQALYESSAFRTLVSDPTLKAIAEAYFRFRPVFDTASMWWSSAGFNAAEDISKAAQMYHIDMDRIRFLNFNIYFTNVTTDNGPHCYVRGSHRFKPKPLRKDGRISDDEISSYYDDKDIAELVGEKGTISVVDTSGFHKGKPLIAGDRLFSQIRFSDSQFGQTYKKINLNDLTDGEFASFIKNNRKMFPGFIID